VKKNSTPSDVRQDPSRSEEIRNSLVRNDPYEVSQPAGYIRPNPGGCQGFFAFAEDLHTK